MKEWVLFLMKEVILYTDGACRGNPGPGGWAAMLQFGEHERVMSGGAVDTTNNRMEIMGLVQGLSVLKEPCRVQFYSDSQYVVNSLEKQWLWAWKHNGWRKSDGSPVKNLDLWKRVAALCTTHNVKAHWVKGHADNFINIRCDGLAVQQRNKFAKLADKVYDSQ